MARTREKKPAGLKVKASESRKRNGASSKNKVPDKPTTPMSAEALIRKAEEQGYLNSSDILAVYPEAEDNLAQLDDLFTYLQGRDIEVVEDESDDKKKKDDEPSDSEFEAEDEREVELAADLSEI